MLLSRGASTEQCRLFLGDMAIVRVKGGFLESLSARDIFKHYSAVFRANPLLLGGCNLLRSHEIPGSGMSRSSSSSSIGNNPPAVIPDAIPALPPLELTASARQNALDDWAMGSDHDARSIASDDDSFSSQSDTCSSVSSRDQNEVIQLDALQQLSHWAHGTHPVLPLDKQTNLLGASSVVSIINRLLALASFEREPSLARSICISRAHEEISLLLFQNREVTIRARSSSHIQRVYRSYALSHKTKMSADEAERIRWMNSLVRLRQKQRRAIVGWTEALNPKDVSLADLEAFYSDSKLLDFDRCRISSDPSHSYLSKAIRLALMDHRSTLDFYTVAASTIQQAGRLYIELASRRLVGVSRASRDLTFSAVGDLTPSAISEASSSPRSDASNLDLESSPVLAPVYVVSPSSETSSVATVPLVAEAPFVTVKPRRRPSKTHSESSAPVSKTVYEKNFPALPVSMKNRYLPIDPTPLPSTCSLHSTLQALHPDDDPDLISNFRDEQEHPFVIYSGSGCYVLQATLNVVQTMCLELGHGGSSSNSPVSEFRGCTFQQLKPGDDAQDILRLHLLELESLPKVPIKSAKPSSGGKRSSAKSSKASSTPRALTPSVESPSAPHHDSLTVQDPMIDSLADESNLQAALAASLSDSPTLSALDRESRDLETVLCRSMGFPKLDPEKDASIQRECKKRAIAILSSHSEGKASRIRNDTDPVSLKVPRCNKIRKPSFENYEFSLQSSSNISKISSSVS